MALYLMPKSQHAPNYEEIVQRIDPRWTLLRTWKLTGGVSAEVTGLEVEHPEGQSLKLIVRRHGDADLKSNPHIARDELRLLQIAESHRLAAPRPYFFDESCELLPTPFVVIEFIEGETVFTPDRMDHYLSQAATQLAMIHRVEDSAELAFLPRLGKGFGNRPAILDQSMNEARIREALEAASPLPRLNEAALLHGDFWPGNLLWDDGQLVAVIDWEDASVGDPLADVGNSRLEILWAFDVEAMNAFTSQYLSMTEISLANLAYWDLCAALRPCSKLSEWGLDDVTEARMRDQHSWFVAEALDRLRSSTGGSDSEGSHR